MGKIVFISGFDDQEQEARCLALLREHMPDYVFESLPAGARVLDPFGLVSVAASTSDLRHMVGELIQVNQQILASNQEMLAELIEMHQDAEESVNPHGHLGMATLG